MNRDPDERAPSEGGPAHDEFEAIVAGWRREGQVPAWPDEEPPAAALFEPPLPARTAPPTPPPTPPPAPPAARVDEDHFVPPEPPPLPRLGPPALVGLALLAVGLVLVVSPGWLGVPLPYGLPLGLVALAAGLGWLVLRLWPDPAPYGDGDGEDDGAVL